MGKSYAVAWECDVCGKSQVEAQEWVEHYVPAGWLVVYGDDGRDVTLCSRQCVKEWALQPDAVPV